MMGRRGPRLPDLNLTDAERRTLEGWVRRGKTAQAIALRARWSAELTNCKLPRSAHRGVEELEADVATWIEAWKADPIPFV